MYKIKLIHNQNSSWNKKHQIQQEIKSHCRQYIGKNPQGPGSKKLWFTTMEYDWTENHTYICVFFAKEEHATFFSIVFSEFI